MPGRQRCIHFDDRTRSEVVAGLREYSARHRVDRSTLFFLQRAMLRKVASSATALDRLRIYMKEHSFASAAQLLQEQGGQRTNMLVALQTDLQNNLARHPNGQRYTDATKMFYESLYYFGGFRLLRHVSANLSGPGLSTMRRCLQRSAASLHFEPGVPLPLMVKAIGRIYKEHKDRLKISVPVSWQYSEDETKIIAELAVHYSGSIDGEGNVNVTPRIVGACGPVEDLARHLQNGH